MAAVVMVVDTAVSVEAKAQSHVAMVTHSLEAYRTKCVD